MPWFFYYFHNLLICIEVTKKLWPKQKNFAEKNYFFALWERMIFSFITQSMTKTTTYIIKKNFKLKKTYVKKKLEKKV